MKICEDPSKELEKLRNYQLEHAYESILPVPKAKFTDLLSLTESLAIPIEHHAYFEKLVPAANETVQVDDKEKNETEILVEKVEKKFLKAKKRNTKKISQAKQKNNLKRIGVKKDSKKTIDDKKENAKSSKVKKISSKNCKSKKIDLPWVQKDSISKKKSKRKAVGTIIDDDESLTVPTRKLCTNIKK